MDELDEIRLYTSCFRMRSVLSNFAQEAHLVDNQPMLRLCYMFWQALDQIEPEKPAALVEWEAKESGHA